MTPSTVTSSQKRVRLPAHSDLPSEPTGRDSARFAVGGQLFFAISNDQRRASRWWLRTKIAYNRLPPQLRWLVLWPSALRLWAPTMLRELRRGKPDATWRAVKHERGMDPWRDVVGWVGGLLSPASAGMGASSSCFVATRPGTALPDRSRMVSMNAPGVVTHHVPAPFWRARG